MTIEETDIEGLKPDNEARIIWAKEQDQPTQTAFVYLHGFGASQREGQPIMQELSARYEANVYMTRLPEHGIYRENSFEFLTPERYLQAADHALSIGRKLGERVILVSTSTGGALSLILAAANPDIAGLILYSPFIDVFDTSALRLLEPGAKEKFIEKNNSPMRLRERPAEQAKYWSTNYHVNGYFALFQVVKTHMIPATFSKVTCPVYLGYYYKNEKEQDQVVSVAAMLKMFEKLGTAAGRKHSIAFPESGDHVIGCDLRSNDWESVLETTIDFIDRHIVNE